MGRVRSLLEGLSELADGRVLAETGDAALRAALRDVRRDRGDLSAWQRLLSAAQRAGLEVTAWTGNARSLRKVVTRIQHGPLQGLEALGRNGYVMGYIVGDAQRTEIGIYPERIIRVELETPPLVPKGGPAGPPKPENDLGPEDAAESLGEADEDERALLRAFNAHPDEAGFRKLVSTARRAGKPLDLMIVYKAAGMPFFKAAIGKFAKDALMGVTTQLLRELEAEDVRSVSTSFGRPNHAIARIYPDDPRRAGPVELIIDGPELVLSATGHWGRELANFFSHGASDEVQELLKKNTGVDWRMTNNSRHLGRRSQDSIEDRWTMSFMFYRELDNDLLGRIFP